MLIKKLWQILERQSLVLTAERRIGKTCIINKMKAEAKALNKNSRIYLIENKYFISHDVEGLRSPLEFVELIFEDVSIYLSSLKRKTEGVRQLLKQLGGTEVAGFKLPGIVAPHWKNLLTSIFEDLNENQDRPVIFCWDELPMMLDNIKTDHGEKVAMEVLDVLRSMRQMYPRLRMVFTGSIGLHHVISSLKQARYTNDPTNDMHIEDVPPLSAIDARNLAYELLKGGGINGEDLQGVAEEIAVVVDGNPFFIHSVVDQMMWSDNTASAETVSKIINTCLTDPQDRWHLHYYRDRLNVYYSNDERLFALNLLDMLSIADLPLHLDELFNQVKAQLATEDKEIVRDVLRLLQRDHYLIQQTDGKYCFRFSLIQRFWRLNRGLTI
jgi:hypothetical protein